MAAPIRFLSGRNQQQKIGIEGSTENQKVLEVVGRVGIGTTIFEPTSELEVRGGAIISGILTASNIEVSVGQVNFSQLNVTGVSTFAGAADFNGSIDVDGQTELDDLNVSGVSTFAGAIDANGNLDVDGQTELDDVNVSGISTFAGAADFNGSIDVDGHTELDDVNVSGAITATTFTGNLAGTVNTAAQTNITSLGTLSALTVSGDITANGNIAGDNSTNITGIAGVTATTLSGTLQTAAQTNVTSVGTLTGLDVDGHTELDNVNVSGVSTFTGAADFNGSIDVDGHTELDDVNVSGAITATTFTGNLTGNADTATSLATARTFELTGDVVASQISFDGTGNVSLAATIQPNSVALGGDTTGDYVESISGTGNQITVSSGTGEGSTPVISIPNNPTLPGTTVTVATDLQVNRNLNVTGNITIGGTTAFVDVERLRITDADIVLGFRTDAGGNEISNDTTASHGGVAVASTEGSPLISLIGVGETLPITYKKIMWFESGAFTGLATDAWLTNYAFGVGTTSMSAGTKFAVGNIETDFDDITSVRNINASGIVTATNGFIGSLTGTATTATNLSNASGITAGIINDDRLPDLITSNIYTSSGVSTFAELKVGTAIIMSAGIITATEFVGGGSGITGITAGQVGALSGVIIREEGGSSLGSVGDINFVSSNLTATASGAAATITLSDTPTFSSLNVTGITTIPNISGVTTFVNDVIVGTGITFYASTGIISATAFFGDGQNLNNLINQRIEGLQIFDEGVAVGTGFTFAALDVVGSNISISAVGLGTTAVITLSDTPTFDTVAVTNNITANGNIVGDNSTNISGINSVTANTFNGSLSGTATLVTVADESSDTTCFPLFATGATGDLAPKSGTNLTFNSADGTLTATDFNTTSDENLKDNIRTIEDPLAKVVQIRGVNFDWKETQKPSVGVIAQEVEKVFPELVANGEKKTVNYNGLIGLLIEVVKEQQTQINSLNERLSKLE